MTLTEDSLWHFPDSLGRVPIEHLPVDSSSLVDHVRRSPYLNGPTRWVPVISTSVVPLPNRTPTRRSTLHPWHTRPPLHRLVSLPPLFSPELSLPLTSDSHAPERPVIHLHPKSDHFLLLNLPKLGSSTDNSPGETDSSCRPGSTRLVNHVLYYHQNPGQPSSSSPLLTILW